ncbi:TetR/AcrR family transcriptional regulator [Agromyces larvae]|uniref:TetR/AcrR family transcriptional regulator n=1 Tax=Agromyces larvae TaxID=2929802 RepID=A0ABY4C3E5_9MICO|nr:TetR/AcrR family transcriptional regulator [Agromyces larvae]UOE45729.1 TetR/AcrR family transcriptional regulator [Agromyces larvae]
MRVAPDEPTAARRARLSPEERRAQLVALGVESLARQPLEEISITDLAARAGVSRPLFFHYFGSKQGFEHAVVRTARDSMLHATEPRLDLDPLDRLRDTLTRTVGFVREHRGTFHSLVRGTASGDVQIREVVEQARLLQTGRVVDLFLERGVTVSAELRTVLRAWIAFTEQVLVDAALTDDLDAERIVELLVTALEGICRGIDSAAASALFDA